MTKGEITFHVPRPPAEVWSVVADLERAPEWVPDLISVTKVSEGDIRVGTRYTEVVNMNGNKGDAELEVTQYDAPRVFANEGKGGPASFSAKFTLEPDGDGTRVTHEYTVTMSGIMKMMEPLMKGWLKKNSEEAVERLQSLIESGTRA
jgi:carbon monoxide dehydrogenase subunit G